MPTFEIENSLYNDGFSLVCGVDEAGRGPFVGPVYAAAVILPRETVIEGLDDSKKLSQKKREKLYGEIIKLAAAYSIAFADVEEIGELNIQNATYLAMNRAISGLSIPPTVAIIDGNRAKGILCPHICVVKGDEKSYSVAAASILAKVSRDRYMVELSEKYPEYGFERHKGYGTKKHREAILKYGATKEHRPLYLRKLLGKK